jgi:hypothetical protein
LFVWLGTSAPAATPREDLLQLVPNDVAFCAVVGDLREHARKLRNSPWVKALRESPLGKKVAQSPEARKLASLETQVQKHLQVGLAELRDDIFGDAVVFAYKPGPPDKPKREGGLVLLWARNAGLLAKVVTALNRDVTLETRVYQEVEYARRTEKGRDNYYYLNGSLLAFSSRKEMIQQVIARAHERKLEGKEKTTLSVLEQFRRLGTDKAFLALWLNPRAFDAHLKHHFKKARGPEAFIFSRLFEYWQALEALGLGVFIRKEFEVKVAVRAKTDKLPEAAQRFFNEASKTSELWNYFPPDALVAVAGCLDASAFARFVSDFLPPGARKSSQAGLDQLLQGGFDIDLKKDVLPRLGPDLGFCMIAPTDKKTFLPSMIWALRVQPGPKKAPVDRALFKGLGTFASLAVFAYNNERHPGKLRLKSVTQDQVEVKYLTNDKEFPRGVKPAFALKQGYLLLASSPEGIRDFRKREDKDAEDAAMPLLRVCLRAWGKFLRERRQTVIRHMAAQDGISRDKASEQLEPLLLALDLLDRMELTQRTGAGQVTWTLAVRAAETTKNRKQ